MTKSMGFIDELSGIYNKGFFFESGKKILSLAKRNKTPLSICIIDIDNLKSMNDKYGTEIGDKIIQEVAQILNMQCRSSDIVAYMKNGQYGLLLYDISGINTDLILDSLRQKIVHKIKNIANEASVSIGACIMHNLMENIALEIIYNQAFAAVNSAKEKGKNRVYIY